MTSDLCLPAVALGVGGTSTSLPYSGVEVGDGVGEASDDEDEDVVDDEEEEESLLFDGEGDESLLLFLVVEDEDDEVPPSELFFLAVVEVAVVDPDFFVVAEVFLVVVAGSLVSFFCAQEMNKLRAARAVTDKTNFFIGWMVGVLRGSRLRSFHP